MRNAIRQTERRDIINFFAYLKIYGKNGKFLTDTLEHMETNMDEIDAHVLKEIETYLVNKSGIAESKIQRTELYLFDENETF